MDDRDVHTEHCCIKHGCKYGKPDECTVCNGTKTQSNPCEYCRDEEDDVADLIKPEEWLRNDWEWRQRVVNEAHNIEYYSGALNVIPKYPSNKDMLLQYAKCFEEACEKMQELLREERK